jgi:hypothetical protein
MSKITENKYLFFLGLAGTIIGLYSFFSGNSSFKDAISTKEISPKQNKENVLGRYSHKFSKGYVKASSYYNPFFDFNISVPKEWEITPKAYRDTLNSVAYGILHGSDENLNKQLDEIQSKNEILFNAVKYSQSVKTRYSPYVVIMGEDIENLNNIDTRQYSEITFELLNKTIIDNNIQVDGTPFPVFIAGKEFYCLKTISYIEKSIVKCNTFMLVKQRNALIFSYAYVTDDDKEECENILKTIKFGKPIYLDN